MLNDDRPGEGQFVGKDAGLERSCGLRGETLRAEAAGAAALATVASSFLGDLAVAQREAQVDTEERKKLASRNSHLRRGMAVALRSGLRRAQAELRNLPADPYDALFAEWDKLLGQGLVDDKVLDRRFPVEFAEFHWEATNTYRTDLEGDAEALSQLLRGWSPDMGLYERWSKDEGLTFARRALPYYRQAFADELAGDADGPLIRAFTVKALMKFERS